MKILIPKKIIICGLADIQNCVDKYNPDKMLTIINKNFSPETPQGMDKSRHIKMLIDDISEPRDGFILPEKHTIDITAEHGDYEEVSE